MSALLVQFKNHPSSRSPLATADAYTMSLERIGLFEEMTHPYSTIFMQFAGKAKQATRVQDKDLGPADARQIHVCAGGLCSETYPFLATFENGEAVVEALKDITTANVGVRV